MWCDTLLLLLFLMGMNVIAWSVLLVWPAKLAQSSPPQAGHPNQNPSFTLLFQGQSYEFGLKIFGIVFRV